MENLIDRKSAMKPINVRDPSGIVYVLDPDDILAVTADRNYTIITRADEQKDVRCRMSFTAMMEALPPIFLRVSRSMAVNIHYIDHLERTQICLVNRACYPIPQRRYNEIREHLDRMNRQGL
jgi:DNA-binding LytR/AlgR family response regulator